MRYVLTSLALIATTLFGAPDVPPPGYQMTEWQKKHPPMSRERRLSAIRPVKRGELRMRPTFNSCGVAWGSGREVPGVRMEYRKSGAVWQVAPEPKWFYDTEDIRGSVLYLDEDSDYELRITDGTATLASGKFRTWASEVPVAKTIELDPRTATYPIRIDAKGTDDGWIRYTMRKGAPLGGRDWMESILVVDGARNVLLDDLILCGGGGEGHSPLMITNSCRVRVRNCEVFGWGRMGVPNYCKCNGWNGHGKLRTLDSDDDHPVTINNDCAIHIGRGSSETVLERCYVHDPRGKANAWFYSHPSGPEAVMMGQPDHSTVIRWCDFVGSDLHRLNDAVEGWRNFVPDGGFNQDADIYGNFMIFCNDDNIELDGGMQNIRCFRNRFEGAVTGVSIQGCIVSPVYVFDNLFAWLGDEFGFINPIIKTAGFHWWWYAPYASVWGNRHFDKSSFCPEQGETARWNVHDNEWIGSPDEAALAPSFPDRPAGFVLDRIGIRDVRVSASGAMPASAAVTVKSVSVTPQPFAVRKSFDANWFTVEPSQGVVPPGGEVRLTVMFDSMAMTNRLEWRSAFLVRAPNGLSRPVSVYGRRTDFVLPEWPVENSATTLYAKAMPVGGEAQTFSFDIKRPGRYWFYVRARAERSAACQYANVAVDEDPPEAMGMPLWTDRFTWTMIRPGKYDRCCNVVRHYDLQAGRHTLSVVPVKGARYTITAASVTDNPAAFEPR